MIGLHIRRFRIFIFVFILILLITVSDRCNCIFAGSNPDSKANLKNFSDNPEYENRLPVYKKYKKENGHLAKPTDVVIMYGHNMKDRSMFGSLRKFEDSEFLKANDKIIIDTLNERKEYEITHAMRIRVNVTGGDDFPYYTYDNFKDERVYNSFIEKCNEHALYDSGNTTTYGDKFVMLTTCEYTYDDGTGRLVIMGKEKQKEEEPVTEPAITPTAINEVEDTGFPLKNKIIIGAIGLLVLLLILFAIVKKYKSKIS